MPSQEITAAASPAEDDPPEPLNRAERALDDLLTASHLLPAHALPGALADHAASLGVQGATVYLADLQQDMLVPFVGPDGPELDESVGALAVDATLAGRAYQHVQVLTQDLPGGYLRVWLPLLNGSQRLGVLSVVVSGPGRLTPELLVRLRRFAGVAAEMVMSKTKYGDTIVRLQRTREMGLAAELQWSLLPPLTFASHRVTVAAALEPAYQVAGDTVDYAVDHACARIGVFDGMGHGLQSAQLAALTVAAYRNARRADRSLSDTARTVDEALLAGFGGEAFATAVLAELDTDTGRLEWVSAGHPEPLLLRDGRLVKTLHVDPAPPLGLGRSAAPDGPADPVAVGSEQLEPGDRVLFYTDGVTEARSPDGDFFGVERLVDLISRNLAGGLPTPETMRRVVRTLLAHQQSQLTDDATMLLLEWRSDESALLPSGPP
ncbi:MAG TPA: PP2C family protein-serine/threonine phosphatase [Mycobacteriales bacterium]|nr:PP2C family protein-serine/threonine phosphatase [Mycobacteriales bacterium]